MAFFDEKTRENFREQVNFLLNRGPNLDDEFWDGLEEVLILSDLGAVCAGEIVDDLKYKATANALKDAYEVFDVLDKEIASKFATSDKLFFDSNKACFIFVGINGTGKTTTVGKLASELVQKNNKVIIGSADTYRAAATEQLQIWADRAGVQIVSKNRGSDPASVAFETIEIAKNQNANFALIDTSGRLHTSDDLMRELKKIVSVVKKQSEIPVYTILVIDATTGQNGLQQAEVFNEFLDLDGLVITKLDGTAKAGIAVQISEKLKLPVLKIGIGEGIDDLKDFDALDFAKALVGAFDERYKS